MRERNDVLEALSFRSARQRGGVPVGTQRRITFGAITGVEEDKVNQCVVFKVGWVSQVKGDVDVVLGWIYRNLAARPVAYWLTAFDM